MLGKIMCRLFGHRGLPGRLFSYPSYPDAKYRVICPRCLQFCYTLTITAVANYQVELRIDTPQDGGLK